MITIQTPSVVFNVSFPVDAATLTRLAKLEQTMAELDDLIAADKASADAALSRVTTDIDALKQQVAALTSQVAGGTATPAQRQALADLKLELDKIDAATLPEPAPIPAPEPEPAPAEQPPVTTEPPTEPTP